MMDERSRPEGLAASPMPPADDAGRREGSETADFEGGDGGPDEASREGMAEMARLRREALRRAREMPVGEVKAPAGGKS